MTESKGNGVPVHQRGVPTMRKRRLVVMFAVVLVVSFGLAGAVGSQEEPVAPPTDEALLGEPVLNPYSMNILVTNDDGVDADGLKAVVARLIQQGHKVYVVATKVGTSTRSAMFNFHVGGKLTATKVPAWTTGPKFGSLKPVATWRLDKVVDKTGKEYMLSPSDSVYFASSLWSATAPPALRIPKPQLVVSGVNKGQNLADASKHSGTVGAASTAAELKLPAIAISTVGTSTGQDLQYWWSAKIVTNLIVALQKTQGTSPAVLTPEYLLNVNAPIPTATGSALKTAFAYSVIGADAEYLMKYTPPASTAPATLTFTIGNGGDVEPGVAPADSYYFTTKKMVAITLQESVGGNASASAVSAFKTRMSTSGFELPTRVPYPN